MTLTPTMGDPEMSRSTPDHEASGGAAKLRPHNQRSTANASTLARKGDQRSRRAGSETGPSRLRQTSLTRSKVNGIKTSANRKTSDERRTFGRRPNEHCVVPWRKIPAIVRFVKRLQGSWINRNSNRLRFAGSESDSLPPGQPFERFVRAFRQPRVYLRDFSACPIAGVLDRKSHGLCGGIDAQP